jgi:transcriptional regulator with PAS, ATPase and Fis domain
MGVVGLSRDYTKEVNRRKELERLSLITQKTELAVMIVNHKGIIEWVNESSVKLTGTSLEKLVGKQHGEVMKVIIVCTELTGSS